MKKVQTIGTIFIFLLGALVFMLILMYGYRGVQSFIDRSETVALLDLEKDIRSAVESIRLDVGSTKRVTVRAPSKYLEICFVTQTVPDVPQRLKDSHALIAEVAQGATQNVFLKPLAQQAMIVDGLNTSLGCHCSDLVGGSATLRFESKGSTVEVSDWDRGAQC